MMLPSFDEVLQWGRRVNLGMLRFLSLTFLFLSLCPLASLYVVFTTSSSTLSGSHHNKGDTTMIGESDDDDDVHQQHSSNSNLMALLRNPNATFEEILTVVLMERANTGGLPSLTYHWISVVPWILSVVFGLVIPVILYTMSLLRSRRLQQERETDDAAYKMRRRREKIVAALSNFCVTLKHEDRDTDTLADSNTGSFSWKIPHPGVRDMGCNKTTGLSFFYGSSKRQDSSHTSSSSSSTDTNSRSTNNHTENNHHHQDCSSSKVFCRHTTTMTRSVSGLCAICLNDYDKGQKVVWSSNPSCCHSFHLDCLVEWFSLRRRKQYLCPCCRQIFFTKHSRQ